MEQDLVVGAVLFANELERAIERLNRAFKRSLDVTAAEAQLVDVPLDFFESALRLLKEQIGAALRLANDQLGLGLRRLFDLVCQPLGGQERVAEVVLALAVFDEERFLSNEVLSKTVDFPQRMLVVIGCLGQERDDFSAVEAAELRAEALLFQIERRDPHDAFCG